MLEFGRELLQLSHRLEQDSGINETNQKMLEVSKLVVQFVRHFYSILYVNYRTHLAYSHIRIHGQVHWVGNCVHHDAKQYVLLLILPYQVNRIKVDSVSFGDHAKHLLLHISESMSYSWRPPIEICLAHACQLLQLMASSSLGSCAFATIEDILQSQ